MKQEHFRSFLQKEYLRRREKNVNYSLRSFARHLKVDPGSLSQFLNGLRPYSAKKVRHLSMMLGLEKDVLQKLLGAKSIAEHFKMVDFDRLHLLRKWFYPAILECLSLEDFEQDPTWIARKLGISISIVNVALHQLMQSGVLEVKADGSWQNNWQHFTTQKNENVDEEPLREHQKQLLRLAAQSIDTNDSEIKSHTAYISAVDRDLIPEIKDEIRKFRRKIANLIEEKSKIKNEVYCMQINLFPEFQKNLNQGEENE
jgi:uncharacterized protein (TIGR02147 family)